MKVVMRLVWVTIPVFTMMLPACWQARAASPEVVSVTMTPQQQAVAASYWTPGRIAKARPLLMVDRGSSAVDTTALDDAALTGPAGAEPAGAADANADAVARAAYPEAWKVTNKDLGVEGALEVAEPTGTSQVYTSYIVNQKAPLWKVYPHRWVGKLTFNTPTGGASCSATSISGNNIVTAAHCVYDSTNNVFYSNWVFSPAYRNGASPYGTFTANQCWVLTAWVNLTGAYSINTWTRYDVAVCKLNPNSSGQTLNNAVGWAGRLWNAGYNQLVFNSGYPANNYLDQQITPGPAQYLRSCTAETFTQTTDTLGEGCNWSRGISGGSWLVGYQPLIVAGQVNSVNSGFFVGTQNLYGARFNDTNIVPLCNAATC
ncbi:MAG: trypsin-like serine protease [Rhodospirillales bacterium]